MTEQQFIDWCDEDTWAEWVDGEVVLMTPISVEHDNIFGFLYTLLRMFVEEHDLGRVLSEPFQVRFRRQRRRRAPDIMFVSKANVDRIKRINIEGAPDLIVEIVSSNSPARDYREKYIEYQAAGVREYWIIDPRAEVIEVNSLRANKRFAPLRERGAAVHSRVLRGFYLKPQWLWQPNLPKVSTILREFHRA